MLFLAISTSVVPLLGNGADGRGNWRKIPAQRGRVKVRIWRVILVVELFRDVDINVKGHTEFKGLHKEYGLSQNGPEDKVE